MLFTILIATYNRSPQLMKCIKSALSFSALIPEQTEIVVVDDGSSDDTAEQIKLNFSEQLASKTLKFLSLPANIGVTRARMAALPLAIGHWIVILDSDDELILNSEKELAFAQLLKDNTRYCTILTRCQSRRDGGIIGRPEPVTRDITLTEMVRRGAPGECMLTIRRDVMLAVPFDPSIHAFESITTARQIAAFGPGLLSNQCIRLYNDTDQADRLSGLPMRIRRADDLARGFKTMLREFEDYMDFSAHVHHIIRHTAYRLLSFLPR